MTPTTRAARAAVATGDFEGALALLADADASEEVLAVRADAAYGAGRFETALHEFEALYTCQLDAGRRADAAGTAATIALHLLVDTGLMSAVRGWMARSERLLGDGEAPARAVLAALATYERLLCGDATGAAQHAARAIALGDAHGVPFAGFLGRIATARLMAVEGRVEECTAILDDVALELMSGRFEPFVVGNLYCELICAAQALMLVDRAREWTDVVEHWLRDVRFGAIHGRCRVHRAEMLRISGPAESAEAEALAACAELRPWMRREFGWPLAELGNVRLRRGDLTGAEEAFQRAHEHAWPPLPGLALLCKEQGDLAAAAQLLAAEITHPTLLPWKERPPIADLQLIPLLEAQAEVADAAGDRQTVTTAAGRLAGLAERLSTPGVTAGAAVAAARAALVAGDADTAVQRAGEAVPVWVDLAAPYEVAVARTVLGRGHRLAGDTLLARMEWKSARDGFAEYGAPRRVAELDALLDAEPAPTGGARVRTAVLVPARTGWRLEFAGASAELPDLKGIRLLRRLLAAPGKRVHVLDLAEAQLVAAGLPVLDDEAKAVYRQRLREVEEDIAEAERDHDPARAELAQRDRDYLVEELSRAVGLGGRDRRVGGTVERARTSVTRTLRYALRQITEELPELGAHLDSAVHTGVECGYEPDPLSRVSWRLEDD